MCYNTFKTYADTPPAFTTASMPACALSDNLIKFTDIDINCKDK